MSLAAGGLRTECCILAGGLSSRMGQDKARLRLGGKTLLKHAREVAQEAGLPCRVIRRDLVPRCGPLGGIYTGLRTTRAQAVLFLACDMPFVTLSLLRKLVAVLQKGANAVCIADEQPGFPFAIRTSMITAVEERIQARRLSLKGLAEELDAVLLPSRRTEPMAGWNINTPEDFQQARETLRRHRRRPSATPPDGLRRSELHRHG